MRLDPSLNATKGCLYVFCANACFDIRFGSCRNMAMMPGTARNGGANCCQSKRKMYRSLKSTTDSEREREGERGAKHIGVCIWMYLVYLQKAAGLFSDMFEGSPTRVESNVRINHAILAHFGYIKCYLQSKSITNQQPIIIFQTLINNPSIHVSMYIDAYIYIHICKYQ